MRINKFLVLLMTSVAMFGGCGGGSNTPAPAPQPKQEVVLSFDSDNDQYPDVFDDYPLDAARWSWGVHVEGSSDAPSPMPVPFSVTGRIQLPDGDIADIDQFAFNLLAGRQYSLIFYDIYGDNAVNFVPAVNVFADGSPEPLPLTVHTNNKTRFSIVLSFTPAKSGIYHVSVTNAIPESQKNVSPYLFNIMEDSEGNGEHVAFVGIGDNGEKFRYSIDKINFLRAALFESVTEKDENGFPIDYDRVSADILWKNALCVTDALFILNGERPGAAATAGAMAAGMTELSPQIIGIKWRDEVFRNDIGINAIDAATGMSPGRIDAPVEDFVIPLDQKMNIAAETTLQYISSANEQGQEESVGGNFTLSPAKLSLGISQAYRRNINYSMNRSTTLVVKYIAKEDGYRVLDPGQYTLTPGGQALFNQQGADAFRLAHGDYFVAGYKRGASFTATLSINARKPLNLEWIKNMLGWQWKKNPYLPDVEKSFQRLSEAIRVNDQIIQSAVFDIKVETIGGVAPAGTIDIKNVIEELEKFSKSVTPANMGKLETVLMHYSQITGGEKIPRTINVPGESFLAIRSMASAFSMLTTAADTIARIPPENLKVQHGGPIEAMLDRYKTERHSYELSLSSICKNPAEVRRVTDNFVAMGTEYNNLLERYVCYEELMSARWGMRKQTGAGENIVAFGGFEKFPLSSVVDNDIDKSFRYDVTMAAHYEPAEELERHFIWDAGAERRLCYIRTHAEHEQKSFTDTTYPSIGRRDFDFLGIGPKWRGIRWNMKAKTIHVGPDWIKYPFNWERPGY